MCAGAVGVKYKTHHREADYCSLAQLYCVVQVSDTTMLNSSTAAKYIKKKKCTRNRPAFWRERCMEARCEKVNNIKEPALKLDGIFNKNTFAEPR